MRRSRRGSWAAPLDFARAIVRASVREALGRRLRAAAARGESGELLARASRRASRLAGSEGGEGAARRDSRLGVRRAGGARDRENHQAAEAAPTAARATQRRARDLGGADGFGAGRRAAGGGAAGAAAELTLDGALDGALGGADERGPTPRPRILTDLG